MFTFENAAADGKIAGAVAMSQHSHHDIIICLPGQPVGRSTRSESCRKGEMLMSTYEEFMVLLTIALLIVAILNLRNK